MVYTNSYKINIILYAILAMIGASFVFIPTEALLNFVFTTLGILIVLINIVPCITYINGALKNKQYIPLAISYSIFVALGFMFIFGWSHMIVSIIFGIGLVILPILRIILSKTKKETLKKELPYILLGLVAFFIPFNNVIGIILKIFGGLIIAYSVYMIILIIVRQNKDNKENNYHNNSSGNDSIVIDAEIKEL